MATNKIDGRTLAGLLQRNSILTDDDKLIVQKGAEWERVNGTPLISILRSDRKINQDNLSKALAQIFDIPCFIDANSVSVDTRYSQKLDAERMETTATFILSSKEQKYICTLDPSNATNIQATLNKVGTVFPVCTITETAFKKLITRDIQPMVISKAAQDISDSRSTSEGDNIVTDVSEKANSDVSTMFNNILKAAIESRASDIHIMPTGKEANVFFRIDGHKRIYTQLKKVSSLEVLKNYIVAASKIPESKGPKAPLQGQGRYKYNDREIDIRVNILRTNENQPDINVRLLDNSVININQLGMNEDNLVRFKELFNMTKGIVLVVGPTGSGKSTTLYAGIHNCNFHERNFLTVEDPVEQNMDGVTQIDVNNEAGASYEAVLKSFLRHDPDVIIVGEIRDLAVARIAFEASNTGHLVFSTLHTNDAISAVPRLVDMGIRPMAICDALAAVLAQRLVRKVCPKCAQEYSLPHDHKWRKLFKLGDGEITLKRGKGCQECSGTGYKGRSVMTELLILSPELRDSIEKNEGLYALRKKATSEGYTPMLQDGIKKALSGETTFTELEPFVTDIV